MAAGDTKLQQLQEESAKANHIGLGIVKLPTPAGRLKDKVVLVTGASRGIGMEIARQMAREGAKVCPTARTMGEGEHKLYAGSLETTVKLIKEEGGEATPVLGDVSTPEGCQAILDQVHKVYGLVDVLVNNASVEWPMLSLDLTPKRWMTTINVCLNGPFFMSQLVLKNDMCPRKTGRVINLSSLAGMGPGPRPNGQKREPKGMDDEVCYGACKAAIERMTHGMASEVYRDEYGKGVAVCCYAPAEVVPTPGTMGNGRGDGLKDFEPVETMARAALLLATEPVDKVNGVVGYSQALLKEFGWPVKAAGETGANGKATTEQGRALGPGIDYPGSGFSQMKPGEGHLDSSIAMIRRQRAEAKAKL